MAKCVFNQVASSCRLLLDEIGDKERSPRSPVVYLEDASETEKTDQAINQKQFAFKVKVLPWHCNQQGSKASTFTLEANSFCFQSASLMFYIQIWQQHSVIGWLGLLHLSELHLCAACFSTQHNDSC